MTPADALTFAAFLASEPWPFHSPPKITDEAVVNKVETGAYYSASVHTYWIEVDDQRCGLVKAFDPDDGTPLFDLRIAAAYRGLGIGSATVNWLTAYLFDLLPDINRIEGTTRADNIAMRALFHSAGFAKEAHYRQVWPGADGALYDAIGYGLLRDDWSFGRVTPVNWNG